MLVVLFQFDLFAQFKQLSVYFYADITALLQAFQKFSVFSLASAHHRGKHLNPRALRQGQYRLHHLVNGLLLNFLSAFGAMRYADARVKQAQIIVDFGNGSYGRARIVIGCLLIDTDGRRKSLNRFHIGLFHLP